MRALPTLSKVAGDTARKAWSRLGWKRTCPLSSEGKKACHVIFDKDQCHVQTFSDELIFAETLENTGKHNKSKNKGEWEKRLMVVKRYKLPAAK